MSRSKTGFSIQARLKSFIYAGRGLRWLIQDEHNARVHLAASILVIVAGIFLDVSVNDWLWLIVAMALVWLAETFNTMVEELCDRIQPDFDPAIGRIKDISAAAVLIASIASVLIGLLVLGPKMIGLFH